MYTYNYVIFVFCSQLLNFMKLVAIVDGDENMQRVSKDQVCLFVYVLCVLPGHFLEQETLLTLLQSTQLFNGDLGKQL